MKNRKRIKRPMPLAYGSKFSSNPEAFFLYYSTIVIGNQGVFGVGEL
jgi:hypothetical protein